VDREPEGPAGLPKRSWWAVLKRTVREFGKDNLSDWAAALTYYSVLSLFPAVIVLMAALGLLGPSATQTLIDNINALVPGQDRDVLVTAIKELQHSQGLAGPLAIIGLAGALWSASEYIGAFMRASNAIYEVPEGRPVWKTVPLRVGLTLGVVVLLAFCAVGVVATGAVAERAGQMLGIGSTGVLVWDIAKWPVLAALVSLTFALLYWAAPNVKHPGFRWLTPGGVLAVVVWALASAGFAFYVANFGSYNKIYGSLGGLIGFLVWLWISNIAILLGAELDAELARGQRIEVGQPAEREPFLPPSGEGIDAALIDLQVHVAISDGPARQRAAALLTQAAYHAFVLATTFGYVHLAQQAALRALDAARVAESPELEAFAMFAMAPSVARTGGRRRAVRMLDRALADAQPLTAIRDGDTLGAETFGLLHLMGAHFAARNSDAAVAADHLDEARRIAVLTGERNGLRQHFGPTNVTVWRVAIGAELGQGPEVAERIEREPIDLDILGSKDRVAALHFDLARSWAQADGERDGFALRHLDAADRAAPQRIRNDPIARDLVVTLDRRARRRVWELDSLRNRFGIGSAKP
jgi:membrane protein